ncbi:MAG: NAD(+)--dinitrogen-reductase ADP-D-ribosyltransferase [Magnetococcales bacterium]|nr:NAD(+)--dinitrogen-reductase ADP-D-ribosyltransferase [Magnetococcales bacterium]
MRQSRTACEVSDNLERLSLPLPRGSWQLFNHCNLTADVLGSVAYQKHPVPLELMGIRQVHHHLFTRLDQLKKPKDRAEQFMDYMVVSFRLNAPQAVGLTEGSRRKRDKMDYQRILRGWLFTPDGRESAALKGWAASRFGLLPRYHNGPLDDREGEAYQHFLAMQSAAIYNTNALEHQLDVLYTYCQYELHRRHSNRTHLLLYRGVNEIDQYQVLARDRQRRAIVLLNNLNSFTENRDRAEEFGDYIMEVQVPLAKIFFFCRLLPRLLQGEDEVIVIGGLYDVQLAIF